MARTPKTPYFPFYGKDAYDDEAFSALSFAAQGLYLYLAWWQWAEGSIPANLDRILDKLPRSKTAEAKKLWPIVEAFFPVVPESGRRQNATIEEHRKKVCAKTDRHRMGAEITNAKRWGSDSLGASLSESDSDSPSDTYSDSLRAASANAIANASASGSPEGVQGEAVVAMPDRESMARIAASLEPSGMVVGGGYVASWCAQYGAEFVAAVIEDVGPSLAGKRPSYLHAILRDRHAAKWTPRAKAKPAVYTETRRVNVTPDDIREIEAGLRYGWSRTDATAEQAREYVATIRAQYAERLHEAPTLAEFLTGVTA